MDLVVKKMGRSPIAARSAREMIEQIKKCTFDLILVNFDLPDINGKEIPFLEKLRSNFSALQLPIILISAAGNQELMIKGLDHGCNDCITVPINGPLVLAQIKNQLKLKTNLRLLKPCSSVTIILGKPNRNGCAVAPTPRRSGSGGRKP